MSFKRPENYLTSISSEELIGLVLAVEKKWLCTKGAAEYLSLSEESVRNMASNGQLPHYKFGRRNRFLISELDKELMKNPRGIRDGN